MKPITSSCVQVGSVVTVCEEGWDDVQQFKIVLPHQTSNKSGQVSSSSPFGIAIMNSTPGTTVTVTAPAGDIRFKVLNVA